MWDLTTALQATAVVAGGALALPPPRAWGRWVLRSDWAARCAARPYVGADGRGAGAVGVVRGSLVVRGAT